MRGGGWNRTPPRLRPPPGPAAPAAEPPPLLNRPRPARPARRGGGCRARRRGGVSGKGRPCPPGLCRCVGEAWGASASSRRGKPRSPGRVGGDVRGSSVSWRASAGYEGACERAPGKFNLPPPSFFIYFFSLKKKKCLFTCVRRRPHATWWSTHLFSCPGRMFFCKNCEVFVEFGVFV